MWDTPRRSTFDLPFEEGVELLLRDLVQLVFGPCFDFMSLLFH